MALQPVSSMVPFVAVVAEVPSDFSIWKSKRKALNWPNLTQGAAHTDTTSATMQPYMHCNSDSNMANHVNQLDFIMWFY